MKNLFQWSAGSIVGTDHLRQFVWSNNQDAHQVGGNEQCLVAVVSDGCGSSAHSELGARIGAQIAFRLLLERFRLPLSIREETARELEWVRREILQKLIEVILTLDGGRLTKQTVMDHFLFTLLVLVITPEETFITGIGDGVYAINGEVAKIGPFAGNQPPYLAYDGLIKSTISPELCRFALHRCLATSELESACIGTDGIGDFENISDLTLPGKTEKVGPLSQFWTEDRFFGNPEAIRRRLNLINNTVILPDGDNKTLKTENGRLTDDTTLIAVRRRQEKKD